jgi:hypothetical protein
LQFTNDSSTTTALTSPVGSSGDPQIALIAGLAGGAAGLLLLIVAIIIFVVVSRRRRDRSSTRSSDEITAHVVTPPNHAYGEIPKNDVYGKLYKQTNEYEMGEIEQMN